MKYTKITTWFLAIAMFMFGILKFVYPFKGWYTVQITNSGLGQFSYSMGIIGEIMVGVILLFSLIWFHKISKESHTILTIFSFSIIIIIMLTGIYVHLHPNVPADVLPLKIKPPYIPVIFLLLALSNIIISIKQKKQTS